MRRFSFTASALLLVLAVGHAADDVTVDGVAYRWSSGDNGYIAAGWDEETSIRSLHIHAVVNDLDVVGIAPRAFEDNADIVHVTIDEGIISIAQNAFCRCENLQTVVLPEGLETIEEEAFAFCASLTTMVIPSTVRDIQSRAFQHCTDVTDVYFLMTDNDELSDFDWWDGIYRTAPSVAGGMEFNTVEHTVIHVPQGMLQDYIDCEKFTAWLDAMHEDDDAYPLWWIVNYGVVGRAYTVADALTAVHVDVNGGLYAKDDNRWLTPDRAAAGEVDYMKQSGLLGNRGNTYDQSNWVVLDGVDSPDNLVGYAVKAGTVTGVLRDKTNPVIEVSSTPEKGAASAYVRNTYIAASLMGRTQVGNDGRTYAFVRPKPQEVAQYEWTIYGGDNDFYIPAPDATNRMNTNALAGGFRIANDLYEDGVMPDLEEWGYYPFAAITRAATTSDNQSSPARRRTPSAYWEPYTDSGVSPCFTVYPLSLPDEPVITTVDHVEAGDTPAIFYDLQGRRSGEPSHGIRVTGDGHKIMK